MGNSPDVSSTMISFRVPLLMARMLDVAAKEKHISRSEVINLCLNMRMERYMHNVSEKDLKWVHDMERKNIRARAARKQSRAASRRAIADNGKPQREPI